MPPRLTLIRGTRDTAHDEARIEAVVARAERVTFTHHVRIHLRTAQRYLAAGHVAAAGSVLLDLQRLNERESLRAHASTTACPCGQPHDELVGERAA